MASILGNFVLGLMDDLSTSVGDAIAEQREQDYDWACRRTDEARSEYQLHAGRANRWLDELEQAEHQLAQLEPVIRSGRYTSWQSSEYNVLKNKIRRIQNYIREERREANSARRSYEMRQEVELKRASRCGDRSFGFDLF